MGANISSNSYVKSFMKSAKRFCEIVVEKLLLNCNFIKYLTPLCNRMLEHSTNKKNLAKSSLSYDKKTLLNIS